MDEKNYIESRAFGLGTCPRGADFIICCVVSDSVGLKFQIDTFVILARSNATYIPHKHLFCQNFAAVKIVKLTYLANGSSYNFLQKSILMRIK